MRPAGVTRVRSEGGAVDSSQPPRLIREPTNEEAVAILRARMEEPGYQPVLAPAVVVAMMFKVTRAAVSNWAARSDRTGVRSYGGQYNVHEVLAWTLQQEAKKDAREDAKRQGNPTRRMSA